MRRARLLARARTLSIVVCNTRRVGRRAERASAKQPQLQRPRAGEWRPAARGHRRTRSASANATRLPRAAVTIARPAAPRRRRACPARHVSRVDRPRQFAIDPRDVFLRAQRGARAQQRRRRGGERMARRVGDVRAAIERGDEPRDEAVARADRAAHRHLHARQTHRIVARHDERARVAERQRDDLHAPAGDDRARGGKARAVVFERQAGQRAQLTEARLHQIDARIERGGERRPRRIDDRAHAARARAPREPGVAIVRHAGRQAAAHHQIARRVGEPPERFDAARPFVRRERRPGQHEAEFAARRRFEHRKVFARLAGDVDAMRPHAFVGEQAAQREAGAAARQVDGRTIGAEARQHAGDIDSAAARIASCGAAAQLAGVGDSLDARRDVDGGIRREGDDFGHRDVRFQRGNSRRKDNAAAGSGARLAGAARRARAAMLAFDSASNHQPRRRSTAACCLLLAACCLLLAACCLLLAACRLPLAACRLPLAACRLPLAACRLPLAACRLPLAACRLPLAACRLPLAACRLPLAACRLPLAACRLPLAACRQYRTSRATRKRRAHCLARLCDAQMIDHFAHALHRPCGAASRAPLDQRIDGARQRDDAVALVDFDVRGLALRASRKRIRHTFAHGRAGVPRAHVDPVDDADHAAHPAHDRLGRLPLVAERHFARERDAAFVHIDVDLLPGERFLPRERRHDRGGEHFVVARRFARQHLQLEHQRPRARDALRGLLRRVLLRPARHEAAQRHDAIAHRHVDLSRIQRRIPIQFLFDILLERSIGFHRRLLADRFR
ncbi:hypothetical protein BURPS1710b_A1062 [Burkholderia pseudomallei 1710b]|uniref:Uncharacterized protein n=1 Tax=Burkholderia pseudomallei (strain 1710b) TaxID=320372 RepID=Q3JJN4_BURP1|nr:hypothetical protein BURPS1710b_A1062 [Burkholderia pseudomallei 1710b]